MPDSACAPGKNTGPVTFVPKYRRLLLPSLGDFLFVVMLALLFWAPSGGWTQLLSDADTGWHLRTGEWILHTHTAPHTDLFSFSKPGAPWFAWEWLADVIFAAAFASQGLKGVVLLSALLICASLLILFRYMLWRGAGIGFAVVLTLLTADASRIHYLARPHLFTLVLLPICLWMLDRDRMQPTRAVWLLVPLAALWTNLHGGFLALIVCLVLWTAGSLLRDRDRRPRRYLLLTCACMLATLANPYGWRLHTHVLRYLRSDWIAANVDEFQPPRLRSEGMYKFEVLLFVGVGLIPVLARRRRYEEIGLIGFWGHAALQSVRHVPIYMIAAAPAAGTEMALLLDRYSSGWTRSSWLGALHQLGEDFSGQARRASIWLPVLAAVLWILPTGQWPHDFPPRFPARIIEANRAILNPARGPAPRLLTSDEWGGYLIYRLYPTMRVFIDGRTDFYGPEIGEDYICLMRGCPKWAQVMDRWHFDAALLPAAWPLARFLEARPEWRVADRDQTAILLQKTP